MSEFPNKGLMIWATVSSRSCFADFDRVSSSLAAKDIINLISVLTILWCPCLDSSPVFGRRCLLWPVQPLFRTLLDFALLHSVPQGQACLLLQVSLDFLLLHSNPLFIINGVSYRKSCRSLYKPSTSASALVVGAWTWIIVMTVMLNGLPWKPV